MLKEERDDKGLSAEEVALWHRHLSGEDRAATEELVKRYLPNAKKLAAVLYSQRHDDTVEFGDYLQYAHVGLLEAIERYNPSREASFVTFAAYRIRGAILSGLENATEIASQKTQRRRLRRERLKSISNHEDVKAKETFIRMVDITLYLAIGYLLEESGMGMDQVDHTSDPYVSVETTQLQRRITLIVEALPERERQIVQHHYFEHKEFSEIAVLINVSKGRISQLHARALKLLRDAYESFDQFDRHF